MISYKNVTREAFVPFKSVNLVNLVTLRHYVKPKVFGYFFLTSHELSLKSVV